MTDYIKREDAIKAVANAYWHGTDCECYAFAHKALDNAPTVDAVPVVRCKDCKFAHMTYGGECKYCDVWESEESLYLDGDFFCAFGERKE